MTPAQNLRHYTASVRFDGSRCRVTVITHIRDNRWLIEGRTLPPRFQRDNGIRRTIVHRDKLSALKAPTKP